MKLYKGVVVANKMTKTVSVLVTRSWMHPVYRKAIKRTKKYLVHDTIGAKPGQAVTFKEVRPMSKLVRFAIVAIEKTI
ncbi:30S ribosomal protein S17 [Microgenomates group bacterium RIFCSPLOWO2_01_FULL_47_10]|nr:ribosomal protein S17 [uncultured bacterium]OGV92391.1 MAG: 30S ribosomal protein S17 [Microgenomates group bacterium RIFCSPLOWO2_01_FULL_47_10]